MRSYQWIKWRRFLLRLVVLVIIVSLIWSGGPTAWNAALVVSSYLFQLLFAVLFMIIQFAALFWFLSRGRTYWVLPGETGATWDDYRGNPEIVENAKRIVSLLRGVKDFKKMGGEAIRGLLLCGPPGTGKSYLAQVIANEAQVPFAYASAPSFQNMFFGVGNLRVMRIYKKARKLARMYGACIIFIDEVDAIGMSRQSGGGGGGLFGMGGGTGLLNELLLQMDPPNLDSSRFKKFLRQLGLLRKKAERPPVLTIAATNLPDVLDQALLRPGRFDRQLWVDSPDYDGRVDVFGYYLRKIKTDSTLTPEKAAMDTIGYSPAQIKHIVNEAVVIAHQRGAQEAGYEDFRAAMETYEWGLKQPLRSMKDDEKRNVAYHEAGHAVAQFLLKPHERVWKVTIIRRGGSLGLAATKPTHERYNRSDSEILAHIQVCLAARAVEEEFLGKKLNGVTSDLRQATESAGAYLGMVGMGDELYSFLAAGSRMDALKSLRPQINELLKDQMQQVKKLVRDHADFVHRIAEELLLHGDLTGEEIERIYWDLYGRPRPEPSEVRLTVTPAAPAKAPAPPAAEPIEEAAGQDEQEEEEPDPDRREPES
ncbi:cell division protease FtsH [Paenibacillus sp. BK033]|uniref:AAA family ATPase n=1 Tax=Paenibacillus sp. BK033 TaxID=2512133 RepID=UPI00104F87AA|nr:AAA family ATPase [Paenibacillus sp. BK033]TCM92890.1 cell division protease FtsH [Paenibacillus sp. BK033]